MSHGTCGSYSPFFLLTGMVGAGGERDGVRMLESSDLFPLMKRRLQEVTEVLSIPESAAAVLLREHKWAKERLFEAFCTDPERVQEQCGVRGRCFRGDRSSARHANVSGILHPLHTRSKPAQQQALKECTICCEIEIPQAEMFAMPCGHEFCRECWRGFVECIIDEGPASIRHTCPQSGCREVVTEDEVRHVAPSLISKFELYQLRSFVEINGMTRWCPGPGCSRVAMSNSSGFVGVAECNCGTRFCTRCGEEPHSPSSCAELSRWREKCKVNAADLLFALATFSHCNSLKFVFARHLFRTRARPPIGFLQIPKHVQSVLAALKRIKDAIICLANNANMNFAGFACPRGANTERTQAATINAINLIQALQLMINLMLLKRSESSIATFTTTNDTTLIPLLRNLRRSS